MLPQFVATGLNNCEDFLLQAFYFLSPLHDVKTESQKSISEHVFLKAAVFCLVFCRLLSMYNYPEGVHRNKTLSKRALSPGVSQHMGLNVHFDINLTRVEFTDVFEGYRECTFSQCSRNISISFITSDTVCLPYWVILRFVAVLYGHRFLCILTSMMSL